MLSIIQRMLWTWLTLLLCFWGSWLTLAQVNFGYPVWHDYAGIGDHIDRYAPLNLYRKGFEETSSETRYQLFADIVKAIHHQGKGLENLTYETSQYRVALLRPAEIIHLKDVSHLISILQKAALYGLIIWLFWTGFLIYRRRYPASRQLLTSGALGALALMIPLLIWGPETVFYQLHIWIFPEQHQWFFYYQESLMSTMMKAPDLFGYIFISLMTVTTGFFILIHQLLQRVYQRQAP
ncbi:DUF1461 domain-containing protein [Hydrogenovibrio sp. SC-1]|uniref:lipoprotein intramolecular transacylase Lit n=1 Tax=Hydrogenovibrio sp. SC-1 TaxID=2065820 RepID=UPI000C7BF2F6|nr:DUF1461 domain-containing protein [Hydrogenovibrio sp. SC-1]PLA74245.1 DUF1461 domain-containing protein [Hydrogenovibrio sp. SC-1]